MGDFPPVGNGAAGKRNVKNNNTHTHTMSHLIFCGKKEETLKFDIGIGHCWNNDARI